jgi:hypothetical protein
MVATQLNKIKKIPNPQALGSKIENIEDIENILMEIETYFVDLESNTNLEFTKDDLKRLLKIKEKLFSILLNVEFSMQQENKVTTSGLRTIGF